MWCSLAWSPPPPQPEQPWRSEGLADPASRNPPMIVSFPASLGSGAGSRPSFLPAGARATSLLLEQSTLTEIGIFLRQLPYCGDIRLSCGRLSLLHHRRQG